MAKRRLGIITLLLCFCLCAVPGRALSASTTDAKEPISVAAACDVTIFYGYEEIVFANQTVNLYQIAQVSSDFQYTLTPAFAPSGLQLNGIQTSGEWNIIRATLESYILSGNIKPIASAVTDVSGNACFTRLSPGLYLASPVTAAQDRQVYFFDSALISLPQLGADGLWQYEAAVSAKPQLLPAEETQWSVVKLWKGDESANRPESITVQIFCNGAIRETVTLSETNNWSYSWTAQIEETIWNVAEVNVPAGYAATIQQRGTAFVITNASQAQQDPPPPQTGDTANILLYAILLFISGAMLVILGIAGKRNRHEETP